MFAPAIRSRFHAMFGLIQKNGETRRPSRVWVSRMGFIRIRVGEINFSDYTTFQYYFKISLPMLFVIYLPHDYYSKTIRRRRTRRRSRNRKAPFAEGDIVSRLPFGTSPLSGNRRYRTIVSREDHLYRSAHFASRRSGEERRLARTPFRKKAYGAPADEPVPSHN